jgi:hypothetical protein
MFLSFFCAWMQLMGQHFLDSLTPTSPGDWWQVIGVALTLLCLLSPLAWRSWQKRHPFSIQYQDGARISKDRLLDFGEHDVLIRIEAKIQTRFKEFNIACVHRDWRRWGKLVRAPEAAVDIVSVTDQYVDELRAQRITYTSTAWSDSEGGMHGYYDHQAADEIWPVKRPRMFLIRIRARREWAGKLSFRNEFGNGRRQHARSPLRIRRPIP